MKPSTGLQRALAVLARYYDAALLATLVAEAEAQTRARSGRRISRADWDNALGTGLERLTSSSSDGIARDEHGDAYWIQPDGHTLF